VQSCIFTFFTLGAGKLAREKTGTSPSHMADAYIVSRISTYFTLITLDHDPKSYSNLSFNTSKHFRNIIFLL